MVIQTVDTLGMCATPHANETFRFLFSNMIVRSNIELGS